MPALCPLCRAAVRPAGAVACAACLETLVTLPRPRCPACGGTCDGVLAPCSECLQFGERPWQHAVSAFVFRDAVRQAVHRLKYQGDPAVVPVLAAAMAPNYRAKPLRRQDLLDNCRFCSRDLIRGLRKALPELVAETTTPIRLPQADVDDILHQDFKRPTGRLTPNPLALKKP